MNIDPTVASTIVASIKDATNHEINFFNTDAVIIASTDASRIGSKHAGAAEAIRTKTINIVDDNHPYAGAQNGINMPVLFNDSVVAVIGVTGQRQEVEPFGMVVKKMTEILIRESLEQNLNFNREMFMQNLINLVTAQQHDDNLIAYLSLALSINQNLPRQAAVALMADQTRRMPTRDKVQRALDDNFGQNTQNIFCVTPHGFTILLDQSTEQDRGPEINSCLQALSSRTGTEFSVGFGSVAPDLAHYCLSYEEASNAAQWQRFAVGGGVAHHETLGIGLLVTSIPRQTANLFVTSVLGNLSDHQMAEFKADFTAYTSHNGSVIHAAQELFIHKNTLQNHLNRIGEDTGYNPRKLSDYTVLSLALILHDYLAFTSTQNTGVESTESNADA
jgi:carbohydrate diacid regulator